MLGAHTGRALRFLVCLATVGLVTATSFAVIHANATTVALIMLLLVLAIATRWGLVEGTFTSIVSVLAFNYYFLPPIGRFTIADPQNWIALFAFLVTAIVASNLAERARRSAEGAEQRRRE